MQTVEILRITGYELNPKDQTVNSIFRALHRTKGLCPCVHDEWDESTSLEDKMCPCVTYRNGNGCHCGLYLKVEK